jgi:hypothetical protein
MPELRDNANFRELDRLSASRQNPLRNLAVTGMSLVFRRNSTYHIHQFPGYLCDTLHERSQ